MTEGDQAGLVERSFDRGNLQNAAKAAAFYLCHAALLLVLSTPASAGQPAPAPVESARASAALKVHPKSPAKERRHIKPAPRRDETVQALAEMASQPPKVQLTNGVLTIEAANSDLGEILKQVADASGMAVAGPIPSARVYGAYGPGEARDVLTSLLTGSGYNFIMTGATRVGTPGELQLALQSGAPAPPSSAPSNLPAAGSEGRLPPQASMPQEELAPGVIAHAPPPPSEDPQERVKQNLNRLQQMRDPQSQQNAPQ